MERPADTIARRARRAIGACALAVALAVLMTWPLASGLGRLGRTTTMDGLYGIWNVGWVARTLVSHPGALFEANIFYPHHNTLAFSESNIGAGVVGIPAWWLTGNAYAAHNSALLFGFASTLFGTWLLLRHLSGDSAGAFAAAIMFAFCPYFFSHSAHIQLLMAGGIPLAMLALHRLVDRPSPARGVVLGLVLAGQALSCAYYGIFAGLMVGYGVLFLAATRRAWRDPRYWTAIALAAATAILCVLPFFLPYLEIQRDEGFRRSLDDALRYSATPASYLATPAHAHHWILLLARRLGWHTGEVLFPGLLALTCGITGLILGLRAPRTNGTDGRDRETVVLYGSLGALAGWASFGPPAILYTALFRAIPLFTFLRAPSRFGLVVAFALAVLASLALKRLARLPARQHWVAAAAIGIAAVAELNVLPFPWERALPVPSSYAALARMPRAPMAEFPFYGERVAFPLHAQYMVWSTTHWMPLLNGYSDHIPQDFREAAFVLDSFPSNDTFAVLQRRRVRYIGVHWDMFGPRAEEIRTRLQPFMPYLRLLASDPNMSLYEIMAFP
ncbi:MAG: hypothetical protein ABJC89_16505 [Acidobacteriota bacterium]